MKMKITKEKIYFIYILLGLLYLISKVVFYIFEFVTPMAVILGLIATALTTSVGFISFKEYKKKEKSIAHWLTMIFPMIILIYTPLHMTIRLGVPAFQFPVEKLAIFLIFECLAIAQIILAIFTFRALKKEEK